MKLFSWVEKLSGLVERLFYWLSGVLLALAVLIMGFEVICRYFFRSPHDWSDEIVKSLVTWVAIVGAVVVTRRQEHIRVDALVMRQTGKRRLFWELGLMVIDFATYVGLGWGGVVLISQLKQLGVTTASSLHIPEWIRMGVLGPCFLLCALYSLENMVKRMIAPMRGKNEGQIDDGTNYDIT